MKFEKDPGKPVVERQQARCWLPASWLLDAGKPVVGYRQGGCWMPISPLLAADDGVGRPRLGATG
uniref:Uncharacterized protein n=1 Tax=Candidatus Kentrum sp. FM TaxID=2126340 RepID=A0A450VXC5_9GAMM|nr:MAG: hypothetical protein BECKFM1743B_GA0114221_101027 [Candidatus Kentron sp. FM]